MDSFVPVPSFDSEKLANSTLILPSVSIGNVPQLTCDLLIHTLQPERVGFIANEAVMPVAGAREDRPGASLAVEVFQTKDQQWTMVQQRAPTIKGTRRQYIRDLVAFIQKYRFSRVIVLTSADASMRTDLQITGIPFRFLGSPVKGVSELESEELLHGTGIGKSLYKALNEAQVPTTMIVMFALEGDNVSDSFHLADVFNTATEIRSTKGPWTPPKSWDHLFGAPVNQDLYQ
ncbi:PAC2 family-domain-containing protein [Zychaea mexicana]|uniref:PAC2 family-domain-containing protein n=1 Tax=Zychaea mexicana TaxID=64656 RepID=UPI0022FE6F5D|nr:PAC2 family-domain-containing protein [Zychaea mexicana]KAI9492006.1 PAC2 family-domain-containing protein [Zychaea mexicana]